MRPQFRVPRRERHGLVVWRNIVLRAAAMSGALLTAACTWFSPDGGMETVTGVAGKELNKTALAIRTPEEAAAARTRVGGLLKRPLTADAAVQIALLNNRGLQAAYSELGIAEAMMVAASFPPNPTFKLERLASPLEIEIERRIVANILALATLPARARIAAEQFRKAQLRAAEETLRVAAETRRAHYRAVAANETAGFLAQAKTAAEAASQLAKRLGESGALNKLDQAREHVFYADITAQLATVRQRAVSERERLTRLMGFWGHDLDFKLPAALPALPPRVQRLASIEVEAIRRRVDLQIVRAEADMLARSYGLTQATRFINLLEVTGIGKTKIERETGERDRARGFELELQVPLFDFGEVRVRQAEATYMRTVNRLVEKAVNVRSEARDAYRTYRSTYDIAGHYRREVLPLRKIISDETLPRYNAMQIDVFALLAEARQRIAATAIEAQRDFWLATVDLTTAVAGGGLSGTASDGFKATAAAADGAGAH
jgi:outer membrane protein TolC